MAQGAACCGGGLAAPALIVGDDLAQFTASYGYSEIIDDVGADGLWRPRSLPESLQTLKLEGARSFADRWQAGLSLPALIRSRADDSSLGLGDLAATAGYEYLTDWDYDPWLPKGLGFFELTLPTGRTPQESEALYQLDARGRGFWALGVGTILTKIINKLDLFVSLEAHKSLARDYANSQAQGRLDPGFGESLGLGAGYNLAAFRFGGSLTWTYEDPVAASGSIASAGSAQRFATAALTVSAIFYEQWTLTAGYVDQTWFGDPSNTSLGRGATLSLQRRWFR